MRRLPAFLKRPNHLWYGWEKKRESDWQVLWRVEKNGASAPIIRWRVDSILTPAVAACHFKNPFKNSISVHRNRKPYTPGGRPLWQETNTRHLPFKRLLFCFHPLQFVTNEYNTAQKMRMGKCATNGKEGRVLFGKKSIFLSFVELFWEVSDSVSFSLHRHWRVLFWPRLWPFLCQLCRQFPVPLS